MLCGLHQSFKSVIVPVRNFTVHQGTTRMAASLAVDISAFLSFVVSVHPELLVNAV